MIDQQYKGYTINFKQSDFVENPLEWERPESRKVWFIMHHNSYDLPNELEDKGLDFQDFNSWHEVLDHVTGSDLYGLEDAPYKFVRWYEHGGVAVSLRDDANINEWDAGIVGLIVGETTEHIKREFASWKCYIEGDVWDYMIEDEYGDIIDSLSGIYGGEYAEEEAKSFIDNYTPPRSSHYASKASSLHV